MNKLTMMLMLMLAGNAWAGDKAHTIRDTDLKSMPYSDAQTLSRLPARSAVEVVKRQSNWTQVKVGTATGWVRMLSLQLDAGAAKRRSDNGLRTLFNVAATGSSGSTVTTGVRGLSEEQLKNTKPNPQELQEAKGNAAKPGDAKRFAADGNLKAQHIDYLKGGE